METRNPGLSAWTGDAISGGSIKLKFIDIPNTSPVILWLGSGVLDPPVYFKKLGDWYLQYPLLFEAGFGSIPGPDGLLELSITVPGTYPAPLTLPLQALDGSTLTNLCVIVIE